MLDAQGHACLTYNGEIYNHRELRAELEAQGCRFKTDHSDTEVILQGYLAWGLDGLLERLNGIFAFALHDLGSRETFLVRDQVGVKPLYFAWARGGLSFASEIKAILALPGFNATLSPAAAYHYLTFMAAPAPLTMFEGIYKLPAGWLMRIGSDGAAQARRYFAPWPSHVLDALPQAEREARVRETLRASVRRQLLADVPVGLFLSGGVDSTALLAIASAVNGAPPDTFSVGFDHETELDETARAAEIAQRYGAKHTEVRISAEGVIARIEQLVREQDEPLADWVCLPLRAVAQAAHDAGLKTVLCGEGADEQFCGYTHYLRYLDVAAGPHKWFSALNAMGVGEPVAQLAAAPRAAPAEFRRFYMRLMVQDRPGVVAAVSDKLAHEAISIESFLQMPVHQEELVPIVLTTQACARAALEQAAAAIETLDAVAEAPRIMPIEESAQRTRQRSRSWRR